MTIKQVTDEHVREGDPRALERSVDLGPVRVEVTEDGIYISAIDLPDGTPPREGWQKLGKLSELLRKAGIDYDQYRRHDPKTPAHLETGDTKNIVYTIIFRPVRL